LKAESKENKEKQGTAGGRHQMCLSHNVKWFRRKLSYEFGSLLLLEIKTARGTQRTRQLRLFLSGAFLVLSHEIALYVQSRILDFK